MAILLKRISAYSVVGKSDFDAIENYRHDQYFKASLGIDQVPLGLPATPAVGCRCRHATAGDVRTID